MIPQVQDDLKQGFTIKESLGNTPMQSCLHTPVNR